MLDNFGIWEFLLLALFALLFFGPERLPQIGAKLGHWLSQLTQYSKAFMNQWSDEALAIQDALQEVKGIRDEIVAAQAEIASSLHTARDEIDGTIREARGVVDAARPKSILDLDAPPPALPAGAAAPIDGAPGAGSGDDVAIAKTQQVLDDLMKNRAQPPRIETSEDALRAPFHTGPIGGSPYPKSQRATQEGTKSGQKAEPAGDEPALQEASSPAGNQPAEAVQAGAGAVEAAGETQVEEEPKQSAFERTQQILDSLKRPKEPAAEGPVPPPAPGAVGVAPEDSSYTKNLQAIQEVMQRGKKTEPGLQKSDQPSLTTDTDIARSDGEPPAAPLAGAGLVQATQGTEPVEKPQTATAFEKTQRILDSLKKPQEGAAAGKVEQVVAADTLPSPEETTAGAYPVERLHTRIAKLEDELQALRDEIRSLRAEAIAQMRAGATNEGAQEAGGDTSVEMNAAAVSVEEAA
jgi:Sec-independent protein translocase protein TatA